MLTLNVKRSCKMENYRSTVTAERQETSSMSENQSVHVNTLTLAELIERNVMRKATAHRIHSRGVTVPRHPSDGTTSRVLLR